MAYEEQMKPGRTLIGMLAAMALGPWVQGQPLAPGRASSSVTPVTVHPAVVPGAGPRIEFGRRDHDFGEVQAGQNFLHTFVFTNTGISTLEILQVRPSCGCTTAGEWDKRVEPGGVGKIPIQFNSANFSGTIQKTVSVVSNDPQEPNVILHMKARVWVPVEVTPKSVMFQYDRETQKEETRRIRIFSNLKEPLKLGEPQVGHRGFKAELQTVTEGKEYELLVSTVPPVGTGTITAPITLAVNDTNVEPVRVQAYAIERQVLVVSPSRLTLPAGPLANELRPTLTIRMQGTNKVVLTEPAISTPGVNVELKELQPGQLFALTPVFPAGFELTANQRVELTVKSDHPRYPVIRVPVGQSNLGRPAPVIRTRPLPARTNLVLPRIPGK
jgi:hypothetical protein